MTGEVEPAHENGSAGRHAGTPTDAQDVLRIRADDGVELAVHRLGRRGATPVLMVPGTFSNHTFWLGTRGTGFARAVAGSGFEAWVLDPRGHGLSERPRGRRWDFDDWGRLDVPAALRAAQEETGRAFLIGHSAGGASALMALAAEPALRERCLGVVVLATPLPRLQPIQRLAAHAVRLFSKVAGRFPARLLGLGPEDELTGVMAQWMSWNLEGHWRGDDGVDYEARLDGIRVPFLAVAGGGDRIEAPPRACRPLTEMIGADDATFLVFARDRGHAEDYDHAGLVVSRNARDEVWPAVIAWLRERDRHAPGGG